MWTSSVDFWDLHQSTFFLFWNYCTTQNTAFSSYIRLRRLVEAFSTFQLQFSRVWSKISHTHVVLPSPSFSLPKKITSRSLLLFTSVAVARLLAVIEWCGRQRCVTNSCRYPASLVAVHSVHRFRHCALTSVFFFIIPCTYVCVMLFVGPVLWSPFNSSFFCIPVCHFTQTVSLGPLHSVMYIVSLNFPLG